MVFLPIDRICALIVFLFCQITIRFCSLFQLLEAAGEGLAADALSVFLNCLYLIGLVEQQSGIKISSLYYFFKDQEVLSHAHNVCIHLSVPWQVSLKYP